MSRLTEKDIFAGGSMERINEGKIIVHVRQDLSPNDEGSGMRHPRNVYVNYGIVKIKSPLNNVTVDPNSTFRAVIDTVTSDTFPTSLQAAATFEITIVMINTGTTTWGGGNPVTLRPVNGNDFAFPAGGKSHVEGTVAPGAKGTFIFTVGDASNGTVPAAGSYLLQFQMRDDTGGVFFPEATPLQVVESVSGQADPSMRLEYQPGEQGSESITYGAVVEDLAGNLLQRYKTLAVTNLPDTGLGVQKTIQLSVAFTEAVQGFTEVRVKLYRTVSTYAAGTSESTIGLIFIVDRQNPEPLQRVFLNDGGQNADTTDTYPASSGRVPGKSTQNIVATDPTAQLPNIIDGFQFNGANGGTIVVNPDTGLSELLIDFVTPGFPERREDWPTADVARVVRGIVTGVASVFVRVFGTSTTGDRVGIRFQIFDTNAGYITNHTKFAMLRVRKVFIEDVTAGRYLWLGWAAGLGLPYPAHPRPRQAVTTAADNPRGLIRSDYHPRFYRNGQGMEFGSNALQTYPLQLDPRGIWRPGPTEADEPNGVFQYELEYMAERLDKHEGTYWREVKDAGTFDNIILEDE